MGMLYRNQISLAESVNTDVKWDVDGLPIEIRLFPTGESPDCYGRVVVYDPKDAQAIMAANTRSDGSIAFDIAHGSTPRPGAEQSQEMHQAVGWGTLACEPDGVWLKGIRWNDDTRKLLKERAFRFISPAFNVDGDPEKGPVKLTGIEAVALTNLPATENAVPIVRSKDAATKPTPKSGTKEISRNMANEDTTALERAKKDEHPDHALDYTKLNEDEREEAFLRMQSALKAANKREEEEDDDEDDDEDDKDDEDTKKDAKRSLVHGMIRDGLVTVKELKALVSMRTKDLETMDKMLRSKQDKKQGRIEEKTVPVGEKSQGALATFLRSNNNQWHDPKAYVARALKVDVKDLKDRTDIQEGN